MPDVASDKKTQAGTQAAQAARQNAPAAGGAREARQQQAQSEYMKTLRGPQANEGEGGPAGASGGAGDAPVADAQEKKASGLENYQAVLGKYLGEKLYGAVSKAVTPDKVKGYAEKALDGSIDYLVKQFGKLAPDSDPKALEAFGTALNMTLKPVVDEFMDAGPGKEMAASLAEYVDAHPREIATIAVLAAIGMVVANAEIPALKTKFKVAQGINAQIEAKLGTFRNISLEQIKGRIEAEAPLAGGTLKAYAEVENKKGQAGPNGQMGPRETNGAAGLDWQNRDGTWKAGARYGYSDQQGHSAEAYVRREDPKKNWYVEGRGGHDQQRGNYGMIGVGWRF
jgi:hypothetical protein